MNYSIMLLEERIVLDGAVPSTVDQAQSDQTKDSQAQTAAPTGDAGAGQDQNASGAPQTGADSGDQAHAEGAKVLVVSSSLDQSETLVSAAMQDVIKVLYDGAADTPDDILAKIQSALGGRQADSIAFANHELGDGAFGLTCGYTVDSASVASDPRLADFWRTIGTMLEENGRIDLLACNLTATAEGQTLAQQIETLSGHSVAASDDVTGNALQGGDWYLERGGVNAEATYFDPRLIESYTGRLVNTAPELSGDATLASVSRDTTNPSGATLSDLFSGKFSDPDPGASFSGVAVISNTANSATQGVWQFSSNGGTNWLDIGTVADNNTALAVGVSSRIRFVPVSGYTGTPPSLSVRGMDNNYPGTFSYSTGTRVTVDASDNGLATPIAATPRNITTSVTAPSSGTPTQTSGTGDGQVAVITDFSRAPTAPPLLSAGSSDSGKGGDGGATTGTGGTGLGDVGGTTGLGDRTGLTNDGRGLAGSLGTLNMGILGNSVVGPGLGGFKMPPTPGPGSFPGGKSSTDFSPAPSTFNRDASVDVTRPTFDLIEHLRKEIVTNLGNVSGTTSFTSNVANSVNALAETLKQGSAPDPDKVDSAAAQLASVLLGADAKTSGLAAGVVDSIVSLFYQAMTSMDNAGHNVDKFIYLVADVKKLKGK